MIVQNPDSLAAEALQAAQAAQDAANGAQTTANGAVKEYARMYCSGLTLEQLYQLGQTNTVSIGALNWQDSTAPDANNVVLIIGNWMTLAISISGKWFRLDLDPYHWTEL